MNFIARPEADCLISLLARKTYPPQPGPAAFAAIPVATADINKKVIPL
ncbi:hypothetical protein FHR88_006464 [Bradyrhizobium betae]|nr:hypothetical protein [Bradyrhizobium betae]